MTEEEWLGGLRHLSNDQIIQVHFGLQEQIKKHYKLRADAFHLEKAIELCKQQIAFAPLALPALKAAHDARVSSYETWIKKPHPFPEFKAPGHHGYYQYSVILRRQKDFDKLAEIEEKRKREGWAG
ncbi:hypothetical protein SJ322_06760 [Serratia marcescens]|uniref:hypothetical protein n=1 Tax=Serratia marcescens TaxID=615 RepID=UPI0029DA6401|nr:hypothetical protein [Serratia marcescens]MDX7271957.1 hypothetical protein [Serratia marcescens]